MYLKNIKIYNFRIIENININLNSNVNIFIGDNAQGKTSILESIYVLALSKSMKSIVDSDLIQIGKNNTYLKGIFKVGNINKKLEVMIDKSNKKLKISDKVINKVGDYISNINVIMFSPDDLDIIKKSPQVRRNVLNIELCQLYPNYLKVLNEYNKVLKIRNEYLKNNYEKFNKDYFDIVTENLIDRAVIIMDYRSKFIKDINSNINKIFFKLMKLDGLEVKYDMSLSSNLKSEIMKFYQDNFYAEVNKKMTLFGPHRDDFSFYLNDYDLKSFGSQGQQRLAILAFKFSEIDIFKVKTGNYPIVLLDDIFSEIDINKKNNLLRFIKSNIQFIITTTDLKNISSKIIDRSSVFNVKQGKIMIGDRYEKRV